MQTQVITTKQYATPAFTGYKQEEIELIKNTVAKNTTDVELAYFLSVAKSVDLNPLVKEIWCYKDGSKNLITFAGRDGFRSIAQRNKNILSVNSSEVCANDSFEMGVNEDGETRVKHSFKQNNRGLIVGAYAIVKLKNKNNVIEYADLHTYNKGQFTWKTHTAEMIKKVAEVHALKKVCNIRGIYAEEEFVIRDGKVQSTIVEIANGNASELKPKALPEKVTKDQISEIRKLLKEKGKTEKNMLATYSKKSIEEFSGADAKNIITMLKAVPSLKLKSIEGEVIKAEPKEEKGKMTKAMDELNKKSAGSNKFVGISADVSAIVNKLMKKDKKELRKDQQELVDDCNAGIFRGESAYPNIFKRAVAV